MISCLVTAPPFILAKQRGCFRQFINRLDGTGRGSSFWLLDLPWSCQPLLHLHSPASIFLHLIGLRPVRIQFVAQATSPPEPESCGSQFSTFARATVYIYIYVVVCGHSPVALLHPANSVHLLRHVKLVMGLCHYGMSLCWAVIRGAGIEADRMEWW